MKPSVTETNEDLRDLINGLDETNWKKRRQARLKLISSGDKGREALVSALTHSNVNIRWQAAKALSTLHDPATARTLVRVMREDEDFSIRWLAAEGLGGMGLEGLEVLLESLVKHADSVWLCEGARHVLHTLHDNGVETPTTHQVLVALQGIEPAITVPKFAMEALLKMREREAQK